LGVADYLQRVARHIASKTDVDQAYVVGKAVVEFAMKGKTDISCRRLSESLEKIIVERSVKYFE
jgi:6-phosphofructokinase